jgi:hypothetical protein
MAIQFGRNAFIQVAEESTYGTAAGSGYTDMRLVSCTLQKTIERARKTHLNQGDAGFVRSTFDAFNITGGNVSGPLHYAGNGDILKAALGAVSSAGSSPTTHSFTVAENLPSLTMTLHRGAAQSGNPSKEEFKGCVINTLTISCAAGEEAQFSAEIIAQDASARATFNPATHGASFPASALPVLHHQSSSITWDGNTYTARSFEITIDNKIERRNLLGSQLTSEPNTGDVREVRFTATMDLDDNTLYNSSITTPTATDSDVVLTMTGTGNNQMVFTIYNAVIEEYSDSVTTFGRIERTITFLGTVDSSGNEAIKINMINDNANPI